MPWDFLHSKLKPVWDWWRGLPEKNLPLFLLISAIVAVAFWLLSKLADVFFGWVYPNLQWGWIMKVLGIIAVAIAATFGYLQFRKAKQFPNSKLSVWRGWGCATFFAVLFLFTLFYKSKSDSVVNKLPKLVIILNGHRVTNGIWLTLPEDRAMSYRIYNEGDELATNVKVEFFSAYDRTNFIYDSNNWITGDYHPVLKNEVEYPHTFTTTIIAGAKQIPYSRPNGCDFSTFSISPAFVPRKNPVARMKECGEMLNSSLKAPTGDFMPVRVTVGCAELTNQDYYIFLKF